MNVFQIHKDGKQFGRYSYPTKGQACVEWLEDPESKEVVEVDEKGRVLRQIPKDECHKAANDFLHPL
jgi:hypothetical protein